MGVFGVEMEVVRLGYMCVAAEFLTFSNATRRIKGTKVTNCCGIDVKILIIFG